jgi:hypothetical protein
VLLEQAAPRELEELQELHHMFQCILQLLLTICLFLLTEEEQEVLRPVHHREQQVQQLRHQPWRLRPEQA